MNKTNNRLAGSILSDPRPIHEAVQDPRYEIGLTARKIAEENYQHLLKSEELRERFLRWWIPRHRPGTSSGALGLGSGIIGIWC